MAERKHAPPSDPSPRGPSTRPTPAPSGAAHGGGGAAPDADARAQARDAVRTAFATRGPAAPALRRCPSCGEERATDRAFCPACGKRYDRRLPWLSDRARWALGGVALVGVALAAVAFVPGIVESKRDSDVRKAAEQAALVAKTRQRLERDQAPHRGSARDLKPAKQATDAQRLQARRALVTALEADILTDARARIAAKQLDGPVKRTECGPLVRSSGNPRDEDDLTKRLGRYDCVAVKTDVVKDGKVVGTFGHPFVAAIDFDRFTYVWCKDNKAPSENGRALVIVPLDRACVGAAKNAPRVGYGYGTTE